MEFIKVILVSVLLSIGYGIIHDMVTANLCVEYFTVGHPKVIKSESPFILALVWGVIATWWPGLMIGIPVAISAQAGPRPKLSANQMLKPNAILLAVMGSLALLSGITGFILAKTEAIYLLPHLADRIEPDRHRLFLAVGWAHGASYLSGLIGGVVLCIITVRKRGKLKNGG